MRFFSYFQQLLQHSSEAIHTNSPNVNPSFPNHESLRRKQRRSFVLSLLGGLAILLSAVPLTQVLMQMHNVSPTSVKDVLGIQDVPESLNGTIVFSIPAKFNNTVTFANGLSITGDTVIDGSLKASNIVYSVTPGTGIGITRGQHPTITNTGVTSLQGQTGDVTLTAGSGISISGTTITNTVSTPNFFGTVSDGTNSFSAGKNNDMFTLQAGTGVTLNTDTTNKKITFNASGGLSGLTTNGVLYATGATTTTTLTPGTAGYLLQSNGSGSAPSWVSSASLSTVSFDKITTGTNVSATMTVGTGGTITYTNSGIINANQLNGQTTSLGGSFTTSGGAVTLTLAGTTNVNLPTTGTLATLAGTETLTNKTLTAPTINGTVATTGLTLPAFTASGNITGSGSPTISSFGAINGLTLTANATGFGIAGGTTSKTLTVSNTLTLAGTDGTTMTFPTATDTVVGIGATQTLTNKTLTAPAINGTVTTTGLTLPAFTAGGNITGSGALSVTSGGATALTLDAGGAAGINIGTTNANGVTIGRSGVTTTVSGPLATSSTVNGLTLTSAADGFTVAGGTTSRTLTVTGSNITLTGGGNTLTLTGSTSINQNLLTTSSPTFAALTLNGNLTSAAGSQWKPSSDSTTGLQIANSSGTPLINFDTTNSFLKLGTGTSVYSGGTCKGTGANEACAPFHFVTATTNHNMIIENSTGPNLLTLAQATGGIPYEWTFNLNANTPGDFTLLDANGFSPFYINPNPNWMAIGRGFSSPKAVLHVQGGNTGGNAAFIVNQTGASANDIFSASASGTTKFTIGNNGNLVATGTLTGLTGLTSSGTIQFSSLSTNGLIKTTSGNGTLAIATSGTDYEVPLTFNNGLTRTSNTIKLGGGLTGNTDLPLSGFNLTFSGSGTVGVGTTSPLATLDVRGNLGTTPVASLSGKTSFAGLVIDNSGLGDLFTASSSGLSRFVITQNGNVGIGVTTPPQLLSVQAASGAIGQFYSTNTNTLAGTWFLNGTYSFGTNIGTDNKFHITGNINGATNLVTVDSSGNMGVGTTTPHGPLEIYYNNNGIPTADTIVANNPNNGSSAETRISLYNDLGVGAGTKGASLFLASSGWASPYTNALGFWNYLNGPIILATNNIERFRIDASGNLGIGTTSPLATLDVRGNLGTTPIASLSGKTSFAGLVIDNSGLGDLFTASVSGTTKFTIANNGNITANGLLTLNWPTITTSGGKGISSTGTIATTTSSATGYGLYETVTNTPATNADTAYGGYLSLNDTGNSLANTDIGLQVDVPNNNTSAKHYTVVLGASPTTNGAFVHSYTAGVNGGNSNDWFGIYWPTQSLYYGISQQLPAPSGTSTVGGYYKGLGIGGSVSGTTDPIFGVLNSAQSANGLGSTAFTIYANNTIDTFNNVLDDGSGNVTLAGGLTVKGTTVTIGNGSSSTIQTSSNAGLTLLSSGTGNITLGQGTGIGDVVVQPNGGGKAALVVNDQGLGDIFTASLSGVAKFTINRNGNVGIRNADTSNPFAILDVGTNGNGVNQIRAADGNFVVNQYGGINAPYFYYSGNSNWFADFQSAQHSFDGFVTVNDAGGSNPKATFDLRSAQGFNGNFAFGTLPIASVSGSTSFSSFIVDQSGVGDLMTASSSGLTRFVLTRNGYMGLGTTNPMYNLDLQGNFSATAAAQIYNTNTTANSGGLIVKLGFTGNGTVPTTQNNGNNFIRFLNGKGESQGSIDSNGGTGVSYNGNGLDMAEYFPKKDVNESLVPGDTVCLDVTGGVTKCISGKSIVGIISSHPSFVGGGNHAGDPNFTLVGLVGQLLAKVSTAQGNISIGDPLTIATDSGVLVKATSAGQIVGHAMESFNQQGTYGQIMVAVQPAWYDPGFYAGATSSSLNMPISASVSSQLQNVPLVADTATISQTLNVLGRTTVTDLGITGNVSAGLITIHGLEGKIDTLAGSLYLQYQRLGGIDFLNGLVTIDTSGNITTQGVIGAQTVQATQFVVKGTTSIGSAVIPQGSTSVEVDTPAMTASDKVFITPTTNITTPLSIAQKGNGKFVIQVSTPQQVDVHFDWFIVKNKL